MRRGQTTRCQARAPVGIVNLVLAAAVAAAAPSQARSACLGDCADSGYVTVFDLVVGVNIALGVQSLSFCPAFDNGSGRVTIDALITAVGNVLHGCPPAPTATGGIPTATPTPTPDVALQAIATAFGDLCAEPAVTNYVEATSYGYSGFCSPSGTQYTSLRIERFDDITAATVAFSAASLVGPPYEFDGLPAAYWERGFAAANDGGTRTMAWQLDCWVMTVHSFDNYGGHQAVAPPLVSRMIRDTAGAVLSARCPLAAPVPTPTATKGPGPDLVVARAAASAHNDTCQPFATLDVCVANAGRTAAGAFAVTVEPGGDRYSLPGLNAGAERCTFRPYPSPRYQPVAIDVDVDGAVDESDETNNQLSASIPYPSVEATCVPTRTPTAAGH